MKPQGASYAYLELPGYSGDMRHYAPAIKIVQNDAAAQAMTHAGLGIQAVNFWTAGTVDGVTADAVASVLVHAVNGVVNIAVADPTQANEGVLHVELDRAASAVVSKDEGVTVERTAPTVRLAVNVQGSQGKAFRVSLGK